MVRLKKKVCVMKKIFTFIFLILSTQAFSSLEEEEFKLQIANTCYDHASLTDNHYIKDRNYKTAFEVYKELAELDNTEAQYNCAHMLKNGYGVSEDKEKAIFWMKKAAASGNLECSIKLSEYLKEPAE
jgi:TPR repeat protein